MRSRFSISFGIFGTVAKDQFSVLSSLSSSSHSCCGCHSERSEESRFLQPNPSPQNPGTPTTNYQLLTRLPHRSLLDSALVKLALKNTFHEDAGRVHHVWIKLPWIDQMFDF